MPEAVRLLLGDPELRRLAAEVPSRLIPEIKLLLNGRKPGLSGSLREELLELLSEVSTRASPELRASLATVMADIEEGAIERLLGQIELYGKKGE